MALIDDLDAARDAERDASALMGLHRTVRAAYQGARAAMASLKDTNAAVGATAPQSIKAEGVGVYQKLAAFVNAMEADHANLLAWGVEPVEEMPI